MKEKIESNSRSLKWEQNGELAHKDLSELIERLKNVESEHASSELSRLGNKIKHERLNLLLRSCFYKNLYQIKITEYKNKCRKDFQSG